MTNNIFRNPNAQIAYETFISKTNSTDFYALFKIKNNLIKNLITIAKKSQKIVRRNNIERKLVRSIGDLATPCIIYWILNSNSIFTTISCKRKKVYNHLFSFLFFSTSFLLFSTSSFLLPLLLSSLILFLFYLIPFPLPHSSMPKMLLTISSNLLHFFFFI